MGINGIGAADCPTAGYRSGRSQKNAAGKNFAEQVNNAAVKKAILNPRNASLVEMRALEAYVRVDKNGGLTSLPPGTGMMGLSDRSDFMNMFQRQIGDMKQLSQKEAAAYYQYSVQTYWDFMNRNAYRTQKLWQMGQVLPGQLQKTGEITDTLEAEDGVRDVPDEKEAQNKTDIVVKPDGSRVLVVTMSVGGMETTMSIEISKPTNIQNDNLDRDNDNGETSVSKSETIANDNADTVSEA